MENEKEKFKEAYERLGSISKVAKEFNMSQSKTRFELLRYKVIIPDYSAINLDLLFDTYQQTTSIRKCSKVMNISTESVREILVLNNKINKPIRYSCNENFFSKDTEDLISIKIF